MVTHRFRIWKPLVAATVATATLAAGSVAAFADGGDGSATGDGGGGAAITPKIGWKYKDDASGAWGSATDDSSVIRAIEAAGATVVNDGGDGFAAVRTARTQALNECVSNFHRNHPNEGDGECRVVAVGLVYPASSNKFNGSSRWNSKAFKDSWYKTIATQTYNYAGQYEYRTSYPFSDAPSRSVDTLMESATGSDNDLRSLMVIALDKYEPAPANYHLRVQTDHNGAGTLDAGSTTPMSDRITASSGVNKRESLPATVWLNVDVDGASYVAQPQAAHKDMTINSDGTVNSPEFTPADFGWKTWQKGSYWFDIDVPKNGAMAEAVNTADRDPRETFNVREVAPPAPTKSVEKPVSASQMRNRTTITTKTGKGGYELTFTDMITPHGVDYTISNMRVQDTTAGKDVTGEYQTSWDKSANTVVAKRLVGSGHAPYADTDMLPVDHTLEFSFDVTVDTPKDFKRVHDVASVAWNHNPAVDTNPQDFQTWQPKPDKSWIRKDKATGRWQSVVDPEHTNKTGADSMTFLDGDEVGSVVNGTIGKNLIAAPDSLTLRDDYVNADYVWDVTKDSRDIRVFEADIADDTKTSVADIVTTGKDVTSQFTISVKGTVVTATAKSAYLSTLKGLSAGKQITLLVPGTINLANGKGAAQVRSDFDKAAGDELTTCTNPDKTGLTNAASEQVNNHKVATNEPNICVYVPPVKKGVLSEASQAGTQESVDGKVVYPGQKVEYRLETQPQLPHNLGYTVQQLVVTDVFDQYLVADKQTVEVTDLATGRIIPKTEYATKWDDAKHQFVLTFGKDYVAQHWANGMNPRVLVRFEGTVSKDAPAKRTVDNRWELTLNNSITPSNVVANTPPEQDPHKADKSVKDKSVSIDGKTLLVGEQGLYQLTLDATQKDTAYKVWRLGMTDDFDEQYVKINPQDITVMSDTGKDMTAKFNIAVRDGVAYVYAKTVDTLIPATGDTVKGDPQPKDLAAYASLDRKYEPLHDPTIDQSLLGHTYTISLPYTVIAGGNGTVVKNTALQVTNDVKQQTETVKNPVAVINPKKDVTVKVGGESVDAKAVYLDTNFLYQLDSSVVPANRAYPEVSQWGIDDQLDPTFDVLSGQWAVYAARDLYKDGKQIAAQGDKIAGSNVDSTKFGGDLFTAALDPATGKVSIQATPAYLQLVSADTAHEQAWRAYIQVKRVKTTERHDNQFTEHVGDKHLTSNIVWTYTPDLTPSLHVEKYDVASGEQLGDRDDVKDALNIAGDSVQIAFKITNTSKTDSKTGKGAYFQAKSLQLADETIAGVGKVEDLKYPDGWDTLVLKPGQSTVVTGTLKGVNAGDKHTDRVKVTGTPLVECPVRNDHPFDDATKDSTPAADRVTVSVDGKDVSLCTSTDVDSNADDWSGYKPQPVVLAQTGVATGVLILIMLSLGVAGGMLMVQRHRAMHAVSGGKHTA